MQRNIAAAILAVALLASFGCAGNPITRSQFWPFDKRDAPDDLARWGPTAEQRIAEVRKLTVAGEQRDRDLARRIYSEMNPLVRVEILKTLGHNPTPVGLAVLRAGLQDPDWQVRAACCEVWGRLRDDETAERLAEVIGSDTNVDVRIAAAKALGQTKQSANIQALSVALDDADVAVRHRAMQSMKLVSGRDYGNDVGLWRQYAAGENPEKPPTSIAGRLLPWVR
jgi:HEAT repeat protein